MGKIITDVPSASCNLLVKNTMNTLHKHYPQHIWMIKADDVGGVVNIFLPHCSLEHGFTVHIADMALNDNAVKNAGGELLERFGMTAGKLNVTQAKELKRNKLSGSVVHDDG